MLDEVTPIFRSLLMCCMHAIHYSCSYDLMFLTHSFIPTTAVGKQQVSTSFSLQLHSASLAAEEELVVPSKGKSVRL